MRSIYGSVSVLLRSEVQREPVFDPDKIHLWLGWAGRTRTLVALFDSYAQLLRSTGVPVPMSFSLRELSSITAHLDFGLTRIHDAPGMLFLLERHCLWRLAYEPLPERMHKRSLLLDETIEMFGRELSDWLACGLANYVRTADVDRELFWRARHYLGLLRAHSGTQPRRTLVFGEVDKCLMRLAGLLFGDWPAKDVEGVVEPAPAYKGRRRVNAPRD
ncbi:hypothetical protein CERSUDRAFT_78626 [Gelatoporia subvermispora B]|uniref:Uncharacterized protein n=1 Tax=Ceriporiopsis subvermispora (strain B) TaxID=914234 RepID=M2P685_CERS8|nr:hypothetical protein CERSUDRAFT_78626 [Gelatoporia subvermispora B]